MFLEPAQLLALKQMSRETLGSFNLKSIFQKINLHNLKWVLGDLRWRFAEPFA